MGLLPLHEGLTPGRTMERWSGTISRPFSTAWFGQRWCSHPSERTWVMMSMLSLQKGPVSTFNDITPCQLFFPHELVPYMPIIDVLEKGWSWCCCSIFLLDCPFIFSYFIFSSLDPGTLYNIVCMNYSWSSQNHAPHRIYIHVVRAPLSLALGELLGVRWQSLGQHGCQQRQCWEAVWNGRCWFPRSFEGESSWVIADCKVIQPRIFFIRSGWLSPGLLAAIGSQNMDWLALTQTAHTTL